MKNPRKTGLLERTVKIKALYYVWKKEKDPISLSLHSNILYATEKYFSTN